MERSKLGWAVGLEMDDEIKQFNKTENWTQAKLEKLMERGNLGLVVGLEMDDEIKQFNSNKTGNRTQAKVGMKSPIKKRNKGILNESRECKLLADSCARKLVGYDYLKDEETKKCLLLSSLILAANHKLNVEDLTSYAYELRLFENIGSIDEARNWVLNCLKELEKARLLTLEKSDPISNDYCVQIDAVVRMGAPRIAERTPSLRDLMPKMKKLIETGITNTHMEERNIIMKVGQEMDDEIKLFKLPPQECKLVPPEGYSADKLMGYLYLKDEETKKCLLLCSLMLAVRSRLRLEDLTKFAYELRLFENVGSIAEARNRVLNSLKELENARLLTLETSDPFSENYYVKMDVVVRKGAPMIANRTPVLRDLKPKMEKLIQTGVIEGSQTASHDLVNISNCSKQGHLGALIVKKYYNIIKELKMEIMKKVMKWVFFKWVFIVLNVISEVSQATITQENAVGNITTPLYLKLRIVASIFCLMIALVEVFHEAKVSKVVWRKTRYIGWFYYPGRQRRLFFGRFAPIFGVVSTMVQFFINLVAFIIHKNIIHFETLPLLLASGYMVAALVDRGENVMVNCEVHGRCLAKCSQCKVENSV